MARKLSVVLDGKTIGTRRTERVYTHAVAGFWSPVFKRAYYAEKLLQAQAAQAAGFVDKPYRTAAQASEQNLEWIARIERTLVKLREAKPEWRVVSYHRTGALALKGVASAKSRNNEFDAWQVLPTVEV